MQTINVGSMHLTVEQQLGEVAIGVMIPERTAGLLQDTRVTSTITPQEARDIAHQLERAATAAEIIQSRPRRG